MYLDVPSKNLAFPSSAATPGELTEEEEEEESTELSGGLPVAVSVVDPFKELCTLIWLALVAGVGSTEEKEESHMDADDGALMCAIL